MANTTNDRAKLATASTQRACLLALKPSRNSPSACQTTMGILSLPGTNITAVLTTSVIKYVKDSQSACAVVLDCKPAISSNSR